MEKLAVARTVKLNDDVMALVRREAEICNRTMADQITHWVRIGRAIEKSGKFDHDRITEALAGRIPTSDLTEIEARVWLDDFIEKLASPGLAEEEFFRKRQKLGRGVGLDADGYLVTANGKRVVLNP